LLLHSVPVNWSAAVAPGWQVPVKVLPSDFVILIWLPAL
jgi:hypothetical protein